MNTPPSFLIELARQAAMGSPCAKSKRAAVAWIAPYDGGDELAIAVATNRPPLPLACDGSKACRAACNKLCVHAETRALLNAIIHPKVTHGTQHMLHLKVIGSTGVATGAPSCVTCAREIATIGPASMWLYERSAPEPRCEMPDGGNRPEYACGAVGKHINDDDARAVFCDHCIQLSFTGREHDHAKCLAWQIETANAGAQWKRYTADEFLLVTLQNNNLPVILGAR